MFNQQICCVQERRQRVYVHGAHQVKPLRRCRWAVAAVHPPIGRELAAGCCGWTRLGLYVYVYMSIVQCTAAVCRGVVRLCKYCIQYQSLDFFFWYDSNLT